MADDHQSSLFRSPFSREQVQRREAVILRHVTNLLNDMRDMTEDEVPYFLVYGILDWAWCLRFVQGNEMHLGFRFYSESAWEAIRSGAYKRKRRDDPRKKEVELRRDHIVPKTLVRPWLREAAKTSTNAVRDVLMKFGDVCVVTKDEHDLLRPDHMPPGWTRDQDIFARYVERGIKTRDNPFQFAV